MSEEKPERKVIHRRKIIGLKVYDAEARYIGDVADLGIPLGTVEGVYLVVRTIAGTTIEVPWKDVAKVGDIVLLSKTIELPKVTPKPTEVKPTTPRICPWCGKPATWIEQYKRWYCYNCGKYLPP